MKFKKKLLLLLLFLTFVIPVNVLAYSTRIILGGDNIGISVNTKEILIVGFYKVNNKYIAKDQGFMVGDRISKVNGIEVNSIEVLIDEINKAKDDKIILSIIRNDKELELELKLYNDNGKYKTGLYIKDQITGIGTLTYIDPETKIFGSLGHEIIDNKTGKIIEIKDGNIFESSITGTIKSSPTTTGEKKATFNQNIINGNIKKNTIKGIFGKWTSDIDNDNLIEVGNSEDITLGDAEIYTVLKNNDVKSYKIKILKVNKDSTTKNILFEINDEILIDKTNGVIKGMSGSPIVQNNKIIGAVTHAILNDNTKGYGIFITTMLEEGEK